MGFGKSLARERTQQGTHEYRRAGFIETNMLEGVPDKVKDKITSEIPFKRFGKPEEIAWGVAYLLSPRASYVTGTVLSINGGHNM